MRWASKSLWCLSFPLLCHDECKTALNKVHKIMPQLPWSTQLFSLYKPSRWVWENIKMNSSSIRQASGGFQEKFSSQFFNFAETCETFTYKYFVHVQRSEAAKRWSDVFSNSFICHEIVSCRQCSYVVLPLPFPFIAPERENECLLNVSLKRSLRVVVGEKADSRELLAENTKINASRARSVPEFIIIRA